MPRALFDILENHALDENSCFLCGIHLTEENRSDEHIFPEWLQHKFDLWNQTLTLLNGTTIPYRQLYIPSCRQCNNEHLSNLERRIGTGIFELNGSARLPSTHDLFLWVGKILFGIIYRELLLPLNRADPSSQSIVDRSVVQKFRMLHFFLQSIRVSMRFHCANTAFPASVFTFDLQCPETSTARFDFKDNPVNQTIYLRLGTKGILAAFDGGAQDAVVGDLFRRDATQKLHPLQFEELGAKLFYKASLATRVPYFLIAENAGFHDVILLSMDDSDNPSRVRAAQHASGAVLFQAIPPANETVPSFFRDWDQKLYAQFLSAFSGVPLEVVNPAGNQVMTWLRDDANRFKLIDIRVQPYRGVP